MMAYARPDALVPRTIAGLAVPALDRGVPFDMAREQAAADSYALEETGEPLKLHGRKERVEKRRNVHA